MARQYYGTTTVRAPRRYLNMNAVSKQSGKPLAANTQLNNLVKRMHLEMEVEPP